jgi:hypothetical protein
MFVVLVELFDGLVALVSFGFIFSGINHPKIGPMTYDFWWHIVGESLLDTVNVIEMIVIASLQASRIYVAEVFIPTFVCMDPYL